MKLRKAIAAEVTGTFWVVLGGCGSAVLSAGVPGVGIGILGVSLAFGLTVLTMAYAFGHISGAHFNPAVTIGLWVGGRFPARDIAPYIIAQLIGALAATAVLLVIATGQPDFDLGSVGFAENGYGAASPGGYSYNSALMTEFVLSAGFLMVIMGATDERAPRGMAPLAIGLALTLIHLISIPVTNTSVNPARSTGPALVVGGLALQQLWMFWVAPIAGGIAGAGFYRLFFAESPERPVLVVHRVEYEATW